MVEDVNLHKYYPEVETARITDRNPELVGRSVKENDSSEMGDLSVLAGEDFQIHYTLDESIEADVPDDSNLMTGLSLYLNRVYSDNVGFDDQEDVEVRSYDDDTGEVTLEISLSYEPDVDVINDLDLPADLRVEGEVGDEYKDELAEVDSNPRL